MLSGEARLLFVFAMGLGLLFDAARDFLRLLTSLPKGGMWMERVKKGFGVADAAHTDCSSFGRPSTSGGTPEVRLDARRRPPSAVR
jgi:hypothetical protein